MIKTLNQVLEALKQADYATLHVRNNAHKLIDTALAALEAGQPASDAQDKRELPPLPQHISRHHNIDGILDLFSADQMREYALAARAATPAQDKQDTAGNDGEQDVPYLIYYDDRDRPTEVIIGSDVAHARFTRISGQWNAHLFVKVKSNSRDDPYFASNAGSQDKQGAVDAEVAGGLMASTLSDFAQMAGYALDRDDCALFDKLRKQWDAAMQAHGERG